MILEALDAMKLRVSFSFLCEHNSLPAGLKLEHKCAGHGKVINEEVPSATSPSTVSSIWPVLATVNAPGLIANEGWP